MEWAWTLQRGGSTPNIGSPSATTPTPGVLAWPCERCRADALFSSASGMTHAAVSGDGRDHPVERLLPEFHPCVVGGVIHDEDAKRCGAAFMATLLGAGRACR